MSKLFQNKAFKLSFSCGLILSVLINYLSYVKSYYDFTHPQFEFSVGSYSAGFPFPFYIAVIGFPNHFYFIWIHLITDILIAVVFSFIIGLIFRFVWSKISPRRIK